MARMRGRCLLRSGRQDAAEEGACSWLVSSYWWVLAPKCLGFGLSSAGRALERLSSGKPVR